MSEPNRVSRRQFGAALTATAAAAALPGVSPSVVRAESSAVPPAKNDRLRFAVKWGMIGVDGPPVDRFRVCQEVGFDGMELISPGQPPIDELRTASAETGMPIHGVVDERHWKVRLSSPEEATRERGRQILEQAIRDSAAMGGHTVLLVPGVVGEEATHDEVWSRSIAQVRRVLPLCSLLGVRVLIENVWNGFCETPEQLRDYLDEIDSPWVGSYFDIGNAQKFAPSEEWIRTLGSRIVKLDVKGWGVEAGFCKIGDGDINWPGVREALESIGYTGWCTAEVSGGGRERLADIHHRMKSVLTV